MILCHRGKRATVALLFLSWISLKAFYVSGTKTYRFDKSVRNECSAKSGGQALHVVWVNKRHNAGNKHIPREVQSNRSYGALPSGTTSQSNYIFIFEYI